MVVFMLWISCHLLLIIPPVFTLLIHRNQQTHIMAIGSVFIVMFKFFDSLGKPPNYYSKFLTRFLESNDTEYQMNTKRLQADSSAVCGHYCLYYCYYRCRGKSMADILKEAFTKDLYLNDLYVYDFVRNHFM